VLSVTAKCIALTIIYMVGHHTNARFIQTATHLAYTWGEVFTPRTLWRGLRGEPLSTNNAYHSPLPLERGWGWGFHPLERGRGWGFHLSERGWRCGLVNQQRISLPSPLGEGSGVRLSSFGEGLGVRLSPFGEGSGVRLSSFWEGPGVRLLSIYQHNF